MKKLYTVLKLVLWCCLGVFIGSSIYRYYDYGAHPEAYVWQSAPWYTSIQVTGIVTVLIAAVILMLMWVIRKKIK